MNILVTGGAGYVGTTLVPLLLSQGHSVAVYDSLRYGIAPILPFFRLPGFSFLRGDIRDRKALSDFARSADAVVHLAAIVGYPACSLSPDEARSVNVDGTRVVAEVAGPSRPVVFASTSSCYGLVEASPCAEQTPLRPVSLYGQTKAEGEQIVRDACNAVIYRIATAFGLSPRMRLDLLISDFVYRALHYRHIQVYEAQARRSFIHVADIARAILMALDKSSQMAGRIYNVGDETQNYTKLEICWLISRIIPEVKIEQCSEGRDLDRRNYLVLYQRIRDLGFQARVSLEEGIRELCAPLECIDRPEMFSNLPPH